VIGALGQSERPRVAAGLLSALRECNWDVRRAAVEALGAIKRPRGSPELVKDCEMRTGLSGRKQPGHLVKSEHQKQLLVCWASSARGEAIPSAAANALGAIGNRTRSLDC